MKKSFERYLSKSLLLRITNQSLAAIERFRETLQALVREVGNKQCLKGKYHANLVSFQNPKMFVCQ